MSIKVIRAAAESQGDAALVTVVGASGSVPRHPGAKMVVRVGGGILGTVGGGRGEATAIEVASRCIAQRKSQLIRVEMLGAAAEGSDMICGGTATLLVEFLADRRPYEVARRALEGGRRVVLVKRLQGPPEGAVSVETAVLEESAFGPDSQGASECMSTGEPRLDETQGVFYDPLWPREKLLILGGGHIGLVLSTLASNLDFDVTVVDDRDEITSSGRFPSSATVVHAGYRDAIEAFPWDEATYVVSVTRGHLLDLECLRLILGRPRRYAGFIASARKARMFRDQLIRDGFDAQQVAGLRAPVGIDIAAETPAEIAISILAEMVAVRRGAGQSAARATP